MTKLRHYDNFGTARFITFSCFRRQPNLINDFAKELFIAELYKARVKYKLGIIGYVIMPEHVHLVVVPPEDGELGPAIGEMKRQSALLIHDLLQRQASPLLSRLSVVRNGVPKFALWKRRCFDHNCRSEREVWEKVNYCHNNPVKRGLVRQPERWRWSSYQYYAGSSDTLLEIDAAGEF